MAAPSTEKVAVAGLARLAAGMMWAAGGLVGAKGAWDCFAGQPEAQYFSPRPWMFVNQAQWARFAGFELTFGLSCVALGWGIWVYSLRLPAWRERAVPSRSL